MKSLAIAVSLFALVLLGQTLLAADAAATRPATRPARLTQAFFTVDDGKTWFVDDAKRIPPFEKDGRPCVRAEIFAVEGNPTRPFVGYLLRYTPEAKVLLEQSQATPDLVLSKEDSLRIARGIEVKKPGDAKWQRLAEVGPMNIVGPQGEKVIAVIP